MVTHVPLSINKKPVKQQRGKTRHWLERYHFVVTTLALGLKINFDQPANQMDGISKAGGDKMVDS